MRLRNDILLQLARHDNLNQIFQSQGNFRDFWRGDGGGHGFFVEGRQETTGFVAPGSVVMSAKQSLVSSILFSSLRSSIWPSFGSSEWGSLRAIETKQFLPIDHLE
jgi:hypothetical protein